jgi:hypothetical protein
MWLRLSLVRGLGNAKLGGCEASALSHQKTRRKRKKNSLTLDQLKCWHVKMRAEWLDGILRYQKRIHHWNYFEVFPPLTFESENADFEQISVCPRMRIRINIQAIQCWTTHLYERSANQQAAKPTEAQHSPWKLCKGRGKQKWKIEHSVFSRLAVATRSFVNGIQHQISGLLYALLGSLDLNGFVGAALSRNSDLGSSLASDAVNG